MCLLCVRALSHSERSERCVCVYKLYPESGVGVQVYGRGGVRADVRVDGGKWLAVY